MQPTNASATAKIQLLKRKIRFIALYLTVDCSAANPTESIKARPKRPVEFRLAIRKEQITTIRWTATDIYVDLYRLPPNPANPSLASLALSNVSTAARPPTTPFLPRDRTCPNTARKPESTQISPVKVTNSESVRRVPDDVASSIFRDFKNAKKQRLTSTIHLLRKTLRLARVASDSCPCKPHLPSLIHL